MAEALATEDPEAFLATEPGLDGEAAAYLASLDVVVLGSDTWALDALPGPDPEKLFPAHQILLAKNGVYLLENVQTAELTKDGTEPLLFVLWACRVSSGLCRW